MPPIGRPTWSLVASDVPGQFDELMTDDLHDVKVVVSIAAPPAKREELAVGRPRRIDHVAHVREIDLGLIGPVSVHDEELRDAAAVTDKSDLLARLRVPGWRRIGTV